MAPDDGPVTRADLRDAMEDMKDTFRNDFGHQGADIADLKGWREKFFYSEDGPWRKQCARTDRLFWTVVIIAVVLAIDDIPALAVLLRSFL